MDQGNQRASRFTEGDVVEPMSPENQWTSTKRFTNSQKKASKGKHGESLKVVYISTPMKVKTSASRFRSLVQELTGKNSDVAHYMEGNSNFGFQDFLDIDSENDRFMLLKDTRDKFRDSSFKCLEVTPTSLNSFLEPIDSVFTSQIDEQLLGFSNNSFPMSFQKCYGDLI